MGKSHLNQLRAAHLITHYLGYLRGIGAREVPWQQLMTSRVGDRNNTPLFHISLEVDRHLAPTTQFQCTVCRGSTQVRFCSAPLDEAAMLIDPLERRSERGVRTFVTFQRTGKSSNTKNTHGGRA